MNVSKNKANLRLASRMLLTLALNLNFILNSWAITPNVQSLVTYETKANAVALRSDDVVHIKHYEIPLSAVERDLAPRLDPAIYKSLIFNKNGVPHVRWIINPEDTKWHKELEAHLRAKGLSTKRYTHFLGYMTASRSYIIEDPITGAQFSAKVSTDKTGGNWRDKKQEIKDAQEIRMATDYVFEEMLRQPFKHVIPMDEPAMFGIRAVDQGMIIRVLADLPKSEMVYLPGFSAVHSEVGAEIAKRNGSNRPDLFWNKNYNLPLARALAEFAARTGLTYDSPHSQNFLIELTPDLKPTGRIVLRDFGDAYLSAEIPEAKGRKKFVENWLPENVNRGTLNVSVGILHGNTPPDWMNDATYNKWGNDFFLEFANEFSRQTGIPALELARKPSRSGLYFSVGLKTTSAAWKAYFAKLSRERLVVLPAGQRGVVFKFSATNCASVFF